MRVRLLAAVAGAALLAASGCTSEEAPEPAPLPTESSSPSDTASPSPTAPTLPAEAEGTSPAAAKAFARHWIAALNWAGPSGDTRGLSAASSDDCDACVAIIDLIDEVHAVGGDIDGKGWEVLRTSIVSRGESQTVVDALVKVHPQEIQRRQGESPNRFPGGRRLKTFWLAPTPSGWIVERLDQSQ